MAFLNSTCYEEVIRKLVSFGGDTDTTCAIAGAFAGLYYKIPEKFIHFAEKILAEDERKDIDIHLKSIIDEFLEDETVKKKLQYGRESDESYTNLYGRGEYTSAYPKATELHFKGSRKEFPAKRSLKDRIIDLFSFRKY